jgi:hypothetical protein
VMESIRISRRKYVYRRVLIPFNGSGYIRGPESTAFISSSVQSAPPGRAAKAL